MRARADRLLEATSALDSASEALLFQQLAATGMTVVSVRTRVELLEFHDVLLELLGDGAWRLSRAGSAELDAGNSGAEGGT